VAGSAAYALASGSLDGFTKALFEAGTSAVEVSIFLLGIVSLWLGIAKVIEDSGLIHRMSGLFRPVLSKLFRNIPPDHPSITSITLNFLANMFGLGNAATPLGIKAMQDLQELNPDKDKVSFEMMLFIVLNTASIQIIPFTVLGMLSDYGSSDPAMIILPTIAVTAVSALSAVAVLLIFRKLLRWK